MKRLLFILTLIAVTAFLVACATQGDEALMGYVDEGYSVAAEEAAYDAEFAPSDSAESYASGDTYDVSLQTQSGPNRLIIRTGNLSIVVEDSEASAHDIAQMAAARDGWLVESDIYESSGAKRGTVTIRIPAEEFDAAVAEIKDMALEVRTESTSSQDVTEEYVDLESRLANLEATADRVRAFLDEARNVEEALEVNRELSRLESEIEVIKGRMKYLSQSAAFSTLTVNLIPDELSQPLEIGGWQPEGVAKDAIEALVTALQGLANVAIWGAIFCLPIALLIGLPLFFIGRYFYRRRKAAKNAAAETPPPAEDAAAEDDTPNPN